MSGMTRDDKGVLGMTRDHRDDGDDLGWLG